MATTGARLSSSSTSSHTVGKTHSHGSQPGHPHDDDYDAHTHAHDHPVLQKQLTKKCVNLRTGGEEVTDSPLARLVFSSNFEMLGGCVVLFNFLIITMETHAKATVDSNILSFALWMNRILLVYYCSETTVRIYVEGGQFFKHPWNVLDFIIVVLGVFTEVMEAVGMDSGGLAQANMLKSLRMLRLLRLVRLLVAFPELYVLVVGIARCMKTLAWAGLLIFIVLNSWAILSVEYLDSLVKELDDKQLYKECDWCRHAFHNVWHANFTWFSIITGDGWSELARPLVFAHPWSYVFFVTSIFIVVWGLLNIIVAAIVDSSIAAREADTKSAAMIAEEAENQTWEMFEQLCYNMDVDGSGEITVDEFKACWKRSSELQQQLKIMGVQEKEMDGLLRIMDVDGSGTLDHNEFVGQFTRMRTLVVKTTIFYLLKYIQDVHARIDAQGRTLNTIVEGTATLLKDVKNGTCGNSVHGNSARVDKVRPDGATDRGGVAERVGEGSVDEKAAALACKGPEHLVPPLKTHHRSQHLVSSCLASTSGEELEQPQAPHASRAPMHSPPSRTDLMEDDPPSTWMDEHVAWRAE